MLIFEERGKPENLEKNLSEEQSKEPTTNLTHSRPEHRPQGSPYQAVTGKIYRFKQQF